MWVQLLFLLENQRGKFSLLFRHLFRLSKHSLVYGLGVAASQLIGFFLLPLYTRYLTPSDYGVLEIFGATQAILGIIFVMGLSSALFMAYFSHDDEEGRKGVISTISIFLTATSLCLVLVLMGVASNLSSLLFDSTQYTFYFRVIFLTLFFDTLVLVPMGVFRARNESKKFIIFSLVRFLASAGLNIYFVVGLHKGVLGILEGNLVASLLIFSLLVPQMLRKIGFKFSRDDLKEMLSFGLPLMAGGFGAWILTLSDRYFLQFLSTPTELGLYSIGYKFGMIVNALIVGPFELAWAPFFWSIAKEKNAKEVYSSILTYFFLVSMFVALALSVLSKEVLVVMTTPSFYGAYKVIPLIALSYVFYGCLYVLAVGYSLAKKTKYAPLIIGTGATANLGLNYLLIPDYGMVGAAVATVISYLLLPIGAFLVSRRYYPIKYEWSRVGKIFIAAALVYIGSLFITNDSAIIAGVLKLISLLGFPLLLFAFKFFKPEETQKTKEIIKVAPGYIRLRLANNGLFRRKQ